MARLNRDLPRMLPIVSVWNEDTDALVLRVEVATAEFCPGCIATALRDCAAVLSEHYAPDHDHGDDHDHDHPF